MTTAFSGRPHFARAFAARSSPRNDATAFICRALAPGEKVGTCVAEVHRSSKAIIQVCEGQVYVLRRHSGLCLSDMRDVCLWQHLFQ